MVLTILGAMALFAPFIIVFNFEDEIKGFLSVFVGIVAVNSVIALVTQLFHVFSYDLAFIINALIDVVCIVFFIYKKKYFFKLKFNWLIIFVIAVAGFELLTVHYFYSGGVATADSYETVSSDYYPYPHYSDEWSGVAFADYSISHKSLPFTNPLWYNQPFPNGLVVFYSFISEILLLLNLNPLIGWSVLAIINGLLVSILVYILLQVNNVSKFSSAVAALSVPLIVNSTNLPGIWFLTPFIFGFTILLASIIFFSKKESLFGIVSIFISLLIYPPLIVLVFPILVIYKWRLALYSLIPIGLAGLIIVALLSINFGLLKVVNLVISWLIRPNLDGGIAFMPILVIFPLVLIPFVIAGFVSMIKAKKYLLIGPIFVGLIFWVLYSFYPNVILIDQSRIVAITSILLVIPVGFGFDLFFKYLQNSKKIINHEGMIRLVKVATAVAFIVVAVFYPKLNNWSKLVLAINNSEHSNQELTYAPTAPITRYLLPDDVRLFSGISGKRFISLPWKGLVIGVVTHNYPLDSKSSTIGNNFLDYQDFMNANCVGKLKYANDIEIDYVYSRSFNCPDFDFIGSSTEGLYLYKFI